MLRCKSSNLCLWSNHFELEERFKNAFKFLWCNEIKFYQQSKKCKVLKMCKEKGGWLSKVNKNEFSYDIFVSFEKVFLMTLKVSTNKFLLLIRFALCTWNLVLQFKKFKPRDRFSVYEIWMVLKNVYSIIIYKDPCMKLLIHWCWGICWALFEDSLSVIEICSWKFLENFYPNQ